MHSDRDEELLRLARALLDEEQGTDDMAAELDAIDKLLEESYDIRQSGPMVYRNYSNNYGRDLDQYTDDGEAYNGDDGDVDLEEYSEAVYGGKRDNSLLKLSILALALLGGILAVLAYWAVRFF